VDLWGCVVSLEAFVMIERVWECLGECGVSEVLTKDGNLSDFAISDAMYVFLLQ
jgi:hypothetical protein